MDLAELRRHVLAALFSEPTLRERLVLKGGNAIEIVHGIAARGSIDLDFSISGDFANPAEVATVIRVALERRFAHEDVLAECRRRVGKLSPFEDVCDFNKRVRELSGIERFHSHLCRHTFATDSVTARSP